MTDVFVSYKREDRAAVDRISDVLLDLGLRVWFDSGLEVGEAWEAKILAQAHGAKAMLVCWTPQACVSEWVLREAEIGMARQILAPVILKPCAPPAPFDAVQAADLSAWDGKLDAPLFQRLLEKLQQLTGNPELARQARLRAGGQHEEMVAILRGLLVGRARSGLPPFSYREAEHALWTEARIRGLTLGEFDQATLWGALDAIAEQNRKRREPPLACMIVSLARGGLPGRGYFQKHVFLEGEGDDLARPVFERHLARVRAWSWDQDP